MFDSLIILSYFFIIIILQSIVGVGVLVLGTPFLLILDYNIIDIFFILLPISMITSFSNLIIINLSNKSLEKSTYKQFKKFFIVCVPSIFICLIILKIFNEFLNFKIIVALVIILSLLLIIFNEKINFKINFFRISILSFVGIIHGLTNSGGTLMSLALSVKNKKNYARLNTTFFYLILATFQYLLTLTIFFEDFIFPNSFKLILVLLFGVLVGNLVNYFLESKTYKMIVNFLAVISAIILIVL